MSKDYIGRAREWRQCDSDYTDEEDEEFGYISGENEPSKAEKIGFELYFDLSGRKGILDGIDRDIINGMIDTHIDIIESNLEGDNQ
jgi:hypothetical protein